jgi:hypothetical protein
MTTNQDTALEASAKTFNEYVHENVKLREQNEELIKAVADRDLLERQRDELLAACKAAAKLWLDDPRTPNGGIADRLNAAIAKAEVAQ